MKIAIIGQGNVAWHLTKGLSTSNEIVSVNSRTLQGLPADADLYLIAVSDDAIPSVAQRLSQIQGIVAHTSGSVDISVLQPYIEHPGVWYPLQTFTKGSTLDYSKIPVFVEAKSEQDLDILKSVAHSFSDTVYEADSNRRRRLHVASVFACNYVNYMWYIADDILRADGLSLDIMLPLIDATTEKIHHLSPAEAQTGPASRGDTKVVETHKQWLQLNHPSLVQIYDAMASKIKSKK